MLFTRDGVDLGFNPAAYAALQAGAADLTPWWGGARGLCWGCHTRLPTGSCGTADACPGTRSPQSPRRCALPGELEIRSPTALVGGLAQATHESQLFRSLLQAQKLPQPSSGFACVPLCFWGFFPPFFSQHGFLHAPQGK